jgi:hypothetical protein
MTIPAHDRPSPSGSNLHMGHTFGDRLWLPQVASDLGLRCVRVIGVCCPALSLVKTHHALAGMLTALVLGFDGVARAHSIRTAKRIGASGKGLLFWRADRSQLVSWSDVVSVRGWRHFGRTSHVAVQICRDSCGELLCCWDYSSAADLAQFLSVCATFMGPRSDARSMTSVRFASAVVARRWAIAVTLGILLCYLAAGMRGAYVGLVYPTASTLVEALRFRALTAIALNRGSRRGVR